MLSRLQAEKTPIKNGTYQTEEVICLNPDDVYRPSSEEKGVNNPTRLRVDENKVKAYQEWIDNPDPTMILPTVKRLINSRTIYEKIYHYELVDGFHRHTAMERNHTPLYWFRVVDHNGLSSGDIIGSQLTMNDHPEHVSLDTKGISNALSTLIQDGYFGKIEEITENMLLKYLNEYIPNKKTSVKELAIRRTMKREGVPVDVNILDEKEQNNFIKGNGTYKLKGKLDKNRNSFGWNCRQGYEERMVMKSLRLFRQTGIPSYFLCQVDIPKGNSTVDEERMAMRDKIEKDMKADICYAYHAIQAGKDVFKVENFFPQDNQKGEKDWIL